MSVQPSLLSLKLRAMTDTLVTCLRAICSQVPPNEFAPQPLPSSLNLPNERTNMMDFWLTLTQGRTLEPSRGPALRRGLRRTRRCTNRARGFLYHRFFHRLYPQHHRRLCHKLRSKLCDWRRLGLRLALSLGFLGLFLGTATPALAFFATFNTKVTQLTTDLAVLVRGCCVLWVVVEIALLIIGRGHMVRLLLPIAGSILLTILPAVKSYFGM